MTDSVRVRVVCPWCYGDGEETEVLGEAAFKRPCHRCRGERSISAPLASAVDAAALEVGRAYATARLTTCGPNDDNDVDASDPGVADAINAAWAEVDRLYAAVRAAQQGGGNNENY